MKSHLRLLAPVLALLCGGALAGCASEYAPPTSTARQPTPKPAELMRENILNAFDAQVAAFVHASETSDANDPALPATTVDPLLSTVRQNLSTQLQQGIVSRGTITPQAHVDSMTASSAVVLSCSWDALIEVYAADGQPVPGQPGGIEPGYDAVRTTMVLTPQGWKASASNVQIGSCPPGY